MTAHSTDARDAAEQDTAKEDEWSPDLVKIGAIVIGLGAGSLVGSLTSEGAGIGTFLLVGGILYTLRALWREREGKAKFEEQLTALEERIAALESEK